MMKYVLLLAVVGLALWWLKRRGGDARPKPPPPPRQQSAAREPAPATMVACVHCGVHLPQADALLDASGRPYCGEAHRGAGPR